MKIFFSPPSPHLNKKKPIVVIPSSSRRTRTCAILTRAPTDRRASTRWDRWEAPTTIASVRPTGKARTAHDTDRLLLRYRLHLPPVNVSTFFSLFKHSETDPSPLFLFFCVCLCIFDTSSCRVGLARSTNSFFSLLCSVSNGG